VLGLFAMFAHTAVIRRATLRDDVWRVLAERNNLVVAGGEVARDVVIDTLVLFPSDFVFVSKECRNAMFTRPATDTHVTCYCCFI
jgi:hypothetical protein